MSGGGSFYGPNMEPGMDQAGYMGMGRVPGSNPMAMDMQQLEQARIGAQNPMPYQTGGAMGSGPAGVMPMGRMPGGSMPMGNEPGINMGASMGPGMGIGGQMPWIDNLRPSPLGSPMGQSPWGDIMGMGQMMGDMS